MVPTPVDDAASEFDIVIVGGGPGGYAAALYGAAAGCSVALVEKDKVGGTCLHRGCIPAKELLATASMFRSVVHAHEFGVHTGHPELDFEQSANRKNAVVDSLYGGLTSLLEGRNVTTVAGFGRLRADRSVEVRAGDGTQQVLRGRNVVLASGSVPRALRGFTPDGRVVLTSDDVLDLNSIPSSVVVIGGGAIGCEFASMLCDLGAQVTLLEVAPTLLPGCDRDVADVVLRSFRKRGMVVHVGTTVNGHEPNRRGTTVFFGDGDRVEVSAVVVSIGRRPFSDGLLDDNSGVEVDDRGFVRIDRWMRTSIDGVFAIGDLVATPQLAHVGFAEAILVVKQILGETAVPVDYRKVPWCIYSNPEVAFSGMTEEAALAAGIPVAVKRSSFGGNGRAQILGEMDGLVKVIAERNSDGGAGRLLGVHMVGPWVTEQIGQAYLAVNWEATPDEISQFVQPHPSLSETFGETVLALTGRGLHVG